MPLARDIRHVHTDLAIVDLSQASAPLPCDTHLLSSLLGKRRGIEHDDPLGFSQLLADLFHKSVS